MAEFWNSKTVDTAEQPTGPSQEDLDLHLGNRSQFVGIMDTPEKVQQHLEEVAKFETVRLAALAELGLPPPKPQPEQWFDCGQCSSPHSACLGKCVKGAPLHQCTVYQQAGAEPGEATDPPAFLDPEYVASLEAQNPEAQRQLWQQDFPSFLADTGDPAMDAALVADQTYLVSMGAVACHICGGDCTGANPPVTNCPRVLAQVAARATPLPGKVVAYSNPSGPGHQLAQGWPQQEPGQAQAAAKAAAAAKRASVDQARQAWRDAVARRAELVRQWDEYIRHLKAEFQRLRDSQ